MHACIMIYGRYLNSIIISTIYSKYGKYFRDKKRYRYLIGIGKK